ncbi:target of Nesh-SH3 [Gastrophryne carolinensis]
MISKLCLLLLCGVISAHLGHAQKLPKVKKLNMKVHINITGDTLVMKFHRPNQNLNLEGFILGYGSNYFSNQYIPWPENGKPYVTDVDAETRYLIAVKPNENPKKNCKDKNSVQKPLQLVIGTLTPNSVYLSWGILINPQVDWSELSKCPNDKFYTVRYREKNKDWNFQLCPTTETVVDNLKPNTMYEFGVKDNSDDSLWSKCLNYKTIPKGKENGNIENTYKIPKGTLQYASEDTKALIPVMVVKQGFQNISKSAPPPTELSPVFREETKKPALTTTRPSTPKPKPVSKVTDSPPAPKSPEKTVPEDPKPVTAQPIVESFTPDSSTGTLEWVRANMVTHPYIQVTNIQTDSSVTDEQSASLAPTEAKVSQSMVLSSTEEPQTKLASPTIAPVQLTRKLPVVHPDIALASDPLATYIPEAKASQYTIPGKFRFLYYKISVIVFQREVPLPYDEQQVSADMPIKLHTVPGRYPVSTVVPKLSPRLPQRHTTILATTSKNISAKPNNRPSQTHTKATTAFIGSDNTVTTTKSVVRPAEPHPVPVPTEMSLIHPKPRPGTEEPDSEADSTQSEISTDVPHTYEPEESSLVSDDQTDLTVVQSLTSKSEHHTTIAYRITTMSFTTNTPTTTTTQRTKPTQVFKATKPAKLMAEPTTNEVPSKTEKAVSSKSEKTSQSPPTTTVPKPAQTKKMPINLISLHIFEDPAPSVESEAQTTLPSIPHITQSVKISQTKPAPKTTQKTPIHLIHLHFFGEPDIPTVPNTTLTPSLSSPLKTQSPQTTAAPYKVQHSSSRPRIPVRPRTRPAQNGTIQGTKRPRPTGEFNWAPGTIPGSRVLDNTKLLGVSRNISMEPNATGKKTFSVSSAPLPPIRPTSIRRRIQASNITGKPSLTVSSPPLPPVKPTSIRRRTNGTGRPATGGILIPRAPSPTRPNCTMVSLKAPNKQPTIPATDEDFVDATVFSPSPKSDIDALGVPRYTAPHVKYVSKEDNIPCSITETLRHFPTEEGSNQEAITPPQNPPSNLSIVTVEGCPSFVILDWEQPDNDTVTEYKVISTENGAPTGKDQSITTTNQTYSTVENLKPNTSYEFKVVPTNPLGEGPVSTTVEFNTESADPRVSEPVTGGKDAIWTEIKFKSDSYSECKGKQYVKRTWYKKFVGIQLCNSLRYKIYLSDTLTGTFYNIGDQSGYGEDHCQFVDSFLDGRTGQQLLPEQLTTRKGFYRSVRQQPVEFGEIGGRTHTSYVHWYECGIAIPGKW